MWLPWNTTRVLTAKQKVNGEPLLIIHEFPRHDDNDDDDDHDVGFVCGTRGSQVL